MCCCSIWDSSGTLIHSSHPALVPPHFSGRGLTTVVWQSAPWRIFTIDGPDFAIQVAQPVNVRRKAAADISLRILIPLLIMIPSLAVLIWVAVGRGLLPLRRIVDEVGKRTPSSLLIFYCQCVSIFVGIVEAHCRWPFPPISMGDGFLGH